MQVHTLSVCQWDLRQVVEVLHGPSRPDGDPVDLVVQAVQEETQELLGILLAAGHRNSQKHQLTLLQSHCYRGKVLLRDVRQTVKVKSEECRKAYLYPTNLGAYLWI